MKLIYCIHSICNPGGMERVLYNKVRYLVEQMGWEVMIVTTDQKQRPSFYPFPTQVRLKDLDINYSDDNSKSPLRKICGYLRRRAVHKRRLTALLMQEKADIVVSLYPSESSFIPDIKDGSRKVLEIHYCKFFRLQYGRHGILGLIDRRRTHTDEALARRFDRFVVLTEEDKQYWGAMPNLRVIPNAALFHPTQFSTTENHQVIAVGRLDYQKGFDRLLRAWAVLKQQHPELADWQLQIYGQGEWHDMLLQMARDLGIADTAHINAPTKEIEQRYVESSLLVMTSNYEGFPMVMVEAMACGLPVVSFDFLTGPKDIIHPEENGFLVPNGNVEQMAESMARVMADDELRRRLGREARRVTHTYSEESVMKQWTDMFSELKRP